MEQSISQTIVLYPYPPFISLTNRFFLNANFLSRPRYLQLRLDKRLYYSALYHDKNDKNAAGALLKFHVKTLALHTF